MQVFALGSCRLVLPMKALHKKNIIDLRNFDYSWYAHNSREMIQRIEVMLGKKCLPNDLNSLVLDLDSCKTELPESLLNFKLGDVGVFELSTQAVRSYNNIVLHGMCITKQSFKDAEVSILTFDMVEDDILKLGSYFKTIVLVCNIERDETLINIDVRRDDFNKFLLSIEKKHSNIRVFNPNEFLTDDVRTQLVDRDHFTPTFLSKLQNKYSSFFQDVLSDNN
jgi:hypothetical protein